MLTYELRRGIAELLSRLRDDSPLLNILDQLASLQSGVREVTAAVLQNFTSESTNRARDLTNKAISAAKTVELPVFFAELQNVAQLFEQVLSSQGQIEQVIVGAHLRQFAKVYQRFVGGYQLSDAFVMLEEAAALQQSLISLRDLLQRVDTALIDPGPLVSAQARFTLVLWSHMTFANFVHKLTPFPNLFP